LEFNVPFQHKYGYIREEYYTVHNANRVSANADGPYVKSKNFCTTQHTGDNLYVQAQQLNTIWSKAT